MKARLVLADDHAMVTEGLKSLLSSECEIVATAQDGRTAVTAVMNQKPDVVVLDISMPLLDGFEVARQIRQSQPKIKIIFLTMHTEVTYVKKAFEVGATGYVVKHSSVADLQAAIRHVLQDQAYVSPLVAKDLVDGFVGNSRGNRKRGPNLTPRQREILQLVAKGRSAKEIAEILNVSPRTVEFHKDCLMQKLHLHTTAQLTHYAVKHGVGSY